MYECNTCQAKGCLSSVCPTNNEDNNKPKRSQGKGRNFFKNKNSESSKTDYNSKAKGTSHNYFDEVIELEESFDNLFTIDENDIKAELKRDSLDSRPIKVELTIENAKMSIELYTGSPISAISTIEYERNPRFSVLKLFESSRKFKSYTGSPIIPLRVLTVSAEYRGKSRALDLFVMPGSSGPIIGREWIRALGIPLVEDCDDVNIKKVSYGGNLDIDKLKKDFPTVFTDELGRYNGGTFKLKLKEDSKPIFVKPRVLPYSRAG